MNCIWWEFLAWTHFSKVILIIYFVRRSCGGTASRFFSTLWCGLSFSSTRWGAIWLFVFILLLGLITNIYHLILINVDVNLNKNRLIRVIVSLLVTPLSCFFICILLYSILQISQSLCVNTNFRSLPVFNDFPAKLIQVQSEDIRIFRIFTIILASNRHERRSARFDGIPRIPKSNLDNRSLCLYCFGRVQAFSREIGVIILCGLLAIDILIFLLIFRSIFFLRLLRHIQSLIRWFWRTVRRNSTPAWSYVSPAAWWWKLFISHFPSSFPLLFLRCGIDWWIRHHFDVWYLIRFLLGRI